MKSFYALIILLALCVSHTVVNAQVSSKGVPVAKALSLSNYVPLIETELLDYEQLAIEDAEDVKGGTPPRFGVKHLVDYNLENSGEWTELRNGDRLWRLKIRCPEALTINLSYSNFWIPKGASFHLYSPDFSEHRGAFTHLNNKGFAGWATGLTKGEEIILEYYEPAKLAGQGTIAISEIVHGYRSIRSLVDKDGIMRAYGSSGGCNNDINCPEWTAWLTVKKSVALILVNGNRSCTGALINNVEQDCTPYFLTANHCLGNLNAPANASNWSFVFNYESPSCGGPDGNFAETASGASLVANGANSDFALFLLDEDVTVYDTYFAGFSNVNSPAANVTGIHHPAGDVMKISYYNTSPVSAEQGTMWEVTDWTDGTTEPGSSGSPLFDENMRIVGQLYGGSAACAGADSQGYDIYGKVSYSWDTASASNDQLAAWLDPNNTGAATVDGRKDCSDAPPVINFTADNTIICPGQAVQFTDFSTGVPTSWSWSFPGGTPSSSTLQNPVVTYANLGTYNVSLTASNAFGSGSNTVNGLISVEGGNPVPVIEDFEAGIQSIWSIDNPSADPAFFTLVNNDVCNNQVLGIDNFNVDNDNRGTFDYFYSTLDLSGLTNTSLTFDYAYARYGDGYEDGLEVSVQTCSGSNDILWSQFGTALATAPDTEEAYIPADCSEWVSIPLDLSAYDGQQITLRFTNQGGWGNWLYLDNINLDGQNATGPVVVNLRAMLEGPYIGGGTMSPQAFYPGSVPFNHPYAGAPWYHGGSEDLTNMSGAAADIVDWVLVEVREKTDLSVALETKAAVMLNNGDIIDVDGVTNGVLFTNLSPGTDYYIVVRHRNHLDQISASSIILPNLVQYDFSAFNTTLAQTEVSSSDGRLLMPSGDFDGDGACTFADYNAYLSDPSAIMQYHPNDCDMDGIITVADYNLYKKNASRMSPAVLQY